MKRLKSPPQTVESSEDILRQILRRLRLKHLARFKLVCKRWRSLISDPDLLRNRPPQPAVGLISETYTTDPPFLVIPFDKSDDSKPLRFANNRPPFSSITIVHACNGLMLCSGKDAECPMLTKRYFVLNPTTMQHTTLPDPTTVFDEPMVKMLGMCLAFDPSTSPHYKVLFVSGTQRTNARYITCLYRPFEVYSSETGSWRIRTNMETLTNNLDIEKGVYWNGALHWITVLWDFNFDSVFFDPHDEDCLTHRVLPRPPAPQWINREYNSYFGESGGHLHLVIHGMGTNELTVYGMKKDYSEWFLKHKSIIHDEGWRPATCVRALVWGNKDEDRFVVYRASGRFIVRYNLVCGTFETLHDSATKPWPNGIPLPYFETTCLV